MTSGPREIKNSARNVDVREQRLLAAFRRVIASPQFLCRPG